MLKYCGLMLILLAMSVAYAQTDKSAFDIAQTLGWVPDPNCKTVCCGFYHDIYAGVVPAPLAEGPITITADQSTLHQTGISELSGKVVVSQPGRKISAEKAYLTRDVATGEFTQASLVGNVSLVEPGKFIAANRGQVDLRTHAARFEEAIYRIAFGDRLKRPQNQLVAWGRAESIARLSSGIFELRHATYSTCAPTNPTWQMSASRIDLDRKTGRGQARNIVLDLHGVPIFYCPYFDFPLDKRRKTGFLFPTVGGSNVLGYTLGIPYYFNLKPNFDDTFTPNLYTKRGVQLNNMFRYLTDTSQGSLYLSLLPNDQEFINFQQSAITQFAGTPSYSSINSLENSSANRWAIIFKNRTRFDEHWSSNIDYNFVSDDYYLQDFGLLPGQLTPNQLLRSGDISYQNEIWNFRAQLLNYLTLHPVNQTPIQNQYSQMPALELNGAFPTTSGVDFGLNTQFVYFTEQTNPGSALLPPTGNRFNIQPSVSVPITELWGYFTPTLQYQLTQYSIDGIVQAQGEQFKDHNITRQLPIFNIDTGIYMDRYMQWGSGDYKQTLEPRLYYLYVPYSNQNDIPEFDTSYPPFTFNTLFTTNRFVGIDRQGDANQISYGFTTRLIDNETGNEKASASLGEIYYFQQRKVIFCTTQNCDDTLISPGATPIAPNFSPIAGRLTYHFTSVVGIQGDLAWDPALNQTNNGSVNVQYHPAKDTIFNMGYNFLRYGDALQTNPPTSPKSSINNLNQYSFSFAFPFTGRWSTLGGMTYNVSHIHPQTILGGLQYKSCCWAFRVVGGETFQSLNQNNNPIFNKGIYVQWQLKGLGNIGNSDPANFISQNIPGYENDFGKSVYEN